MNDAAQPRRPHDRVLRTALLVVAGAFLFGFGMVPLYRIACENVFGIKLEQGAADGQRVAQWAVDPTRTITVQFDATVNSALPWRFVPETTSLQVHPGAPTDAYFLATNSSADAIVGQAVPSVAPSTASTYFNKTECFCFTEQLLQSGETRRMPVRFVIDPALPEGISTLTLSYTFYNNTLATARLARASTASLSPSATRMD